MEDFKTFEIDITKHKMVMLELQQKLHKLLEDNKLTEAFELLEKSKYYKSIKDFNQKVADFKKRLDATPLTSENIEFIKKSKQYLSQFQSNDEETNQLFFDKIDSLIEEKNAALKEKDFKTANAIREEIIAIQIKILS